jgi:outer membrane protein assembly factor BamA
VVDRLYPQVRISMFSGAIAWDRRDDPLSASRGGLIAVNTDVALKAVGSEVSFIKTFAEATVFRPLIGPKRLIFAGRAQLGLARGFDPNTNIENEFDDPLRDLPASQRLFSGGSATHRGFQLDRLGAEDVLAPDGSVLVKGVLTPDGLSRGGNGLVLFTAELRALAGRLLNRELHVVGFVDVGNVFYRVSTIDMSQLRTGVGFGIRYDSWIGPLRLDFGFKTERKMFTGGLERRWEFHLSIGEVF